jgi:alkyldihydroxyacetonephosphate synthase
MKPAPASDLTDDYIVKRLSTCVDADRVSTDLTTRMAYARDAYPPALKGAADGVSPFMPAVVVWPDSTAEVREVVLAAQELRLTIVPYGAGSVVVGGALARPGALVVDLKRLSRIISVDAVSLTATVQAGILGKVLEDELNARGLTCGHFPQSINSSTLGGWIAHRGAGTFSTKYGKIDDLVLSVEVVLPDGQILQTRTVPQSAAGPDLRRLFLGAEGTLGIVTSATIQVFPLPAARLHRSFVLPSFVDGLESARRIVHRGLRPAVIRIYDPVETQAQFSSLGIAPGSAAVLLVAEGDQELTEFTMKQASAQLLGMGAVDLGSSVGDYWFTHRLSTAGLCRTLAKVGGVADSLEVANVWSRLPATYAGMKAAMEAAAGERGSVYGHSSHFYHSGANLYMIFHALADDPSDTYALYERILAAAFDSCLSEGGTLTHHHGVGLAKQRWLPEDWGTAGYWLWHAIRRGIDPSGLMNSEKLGGGA